MSGVRKEDLRIVFMGTPEFAVQSLKAIVEENYNVVGVVTAPDKPAGRGQKLMESEVKKFALERNLTVLQPVSLKSPDFISALKELNPNLQVVVAFRMLPAEVWEFPKLGTFNLHASLLPQYRGAAPINHVLINGETETGLTTFFLQHEIDTGNIICRETEPVFENDNAETLHDRLMTKGAILVTRTIEKILSGNYKLINQLTLSGDSTVLKPAPKIFKDNCRITWEKESHVIHNLIRGLSPYPAAWTVLNINDSELQLKIFASEFITESHEKLPGLIETDGKKYIKVITGDGFIFLKDLQLAGKKRMKSEDFLRGFRFEKGMSFK